MTFLLSKVDAQIEQNQLYEFNFGRNKLEGVQLVFSSTNQSGEGRKWKSVPIQDSIHYFFLGTQEHELLGTENYKIYLWRPDGGSILFQEEVMLRTINNAAK